MNDDKKPYEFQWTEDSTVGVVAQDIASINSELNTITLDIGNYGAASDTVYMDSNMSGTIDLSNISITNGSPGFTFASGSVDMSNSIRGVDTIVSKDGKSINVDEMIDIFESIKKRLLILTPNFEMHEKYPMLKELYDEYRAMEKLLGGPDRGLDEDL